MSVIIIHWDRILILAFGICVGAVAMAQLIGIRFHMVRRRKNMDEDGELHERLEIIRNEQFEFEKGLHSDKNSAND
jgi:hypothetical protein